MTLAQVQPHGGVLVRLLVSAERRVELLAQCAAAPYWRLTAKQSCDLEMLSQGAFSPLTGFMGSADCYGVCNEMRLGSGLLWPLPVTLDVSDECARALRPGSVLVLRDAIHAPLAVVHVDELWQPDRQAEAEAVFGTASLDHAGARSYLRETHPWYVAGRVEAFALPAHHDFTHLRFEPRALRDVFARDGWMRVVAFQTRNPMHRAHQELTLRAARHADAKLLLHPAVGVDHAGDIDHYSRVRSYQALMGEYAEGSARLALLPLAMRMAGPREALLHALIRQNYGCTHFVVGRDHASPGRRGDGSAFYRPMDAQELLRGAATELGIEVMPYPELLYVEGTGYVPADEIPEDTPAKSVSGAKLRALLESGADIPEWFMHPTVSRELRRAHPPRHAQGLTLFLTGLSGAGKTTLAHALMAKLLELGGRPVTVLDGDTVRLELSPELGYSKDDRDTHLRRIGFVAAQITRSRGVAICAAIAPYDRVRHEVRVRVSLEGAFVLVHVATPLGICEQRDPKGLYAKARNGQLHDFTGISQPYEVPLDADLRIDLTATTPAEGAEQILRWLQDGKYIAGCDAHSRERDNALSGGEHCWQED